MDHINFYPVVKRSFKEDCHENLIIFSIFILPISPCVVRILHQLKKLPFMYFVYVVLYFCT